MKRPNTIIGIDPGASNGGIATWKLGRPTTTQRVPKNEDIGRISEYFKHLKSIDDDVIVFIEKVQMFGSDTDKETNPGKQFRIRVMLDNYAKLISLLVFHNIKYIEVYPVSWQSTLGLKKKHHSDKDINDKMKKASFKEYAKNAFPECKVTLWSSDALCLVQFALTKFENNPEWIVKYLKNNKEGLF